MVLRGEGGSGAPVWSHGSNKLLTASAPAPCVQYPIFSRGRGRLEPWVDLAGFRARRWLPPGYEENPIKRYPLLIALDGSNLFRAEESFSRTEWRVDETVEALDAASVIDQVLVVGVDSAQREVDFTGSDAFARWVAEVLLPWAEADGRSLGLPGQRAILGASLGAIAALHLVWTRPDLARTGLCLSGTFGWRGPLEQQLASGPLPPVRLWLDSGWPGDNFEPTRALAHTLLDRGLVWGHQLMYLTFPHAAHHESAWADRLHLPFQFAFGKAANRPRPSE